MEAPMAVTHYLLPTLYLLLCLLSSPAMSSENDTTYHPQRSPSSPESSRSLPMVLTLIFLMFFFVGFFSLYLCRCVMERTCFLLLQYPRRNSGSTAATVASQGLDSSILATFPTFAYSIVKTLRIGKNSLECAVCLCEFDDDDIIRLLPSCNHAFHRDCIDIWLASHTTCPVCRSNLKELRQSQLNPPSLLPEETQEQNSGNVSRQVSFMESERGGGDGNEDGSKQNQPTVQVDIERLSRSHSTGHSMTATVSCDVFLCSGDDDRFTLRLPENIKDRITRGRNWTGSCVTFGDYGSGEGDSNVGGRGIPMAGKSEGLTGSAVRPHFSCGAVSPVEVASEQSGRSEGEAPRQLAASRTRL